MKHKGLFFALGVSLFLSCGVISFSHQDVEVKADGVVDAGEISFSLYAAHSTISSGLYLVGDTDNIIPTSWDDSLNPTDATGCVLKNDVDITKPDFRIKKHPDYANGYYLALGDAGYGSRMVDDKIELKGHWALVKDGTTYNLTINKFVVVWNGTKWVEQFVEPDLVPYDKVSLVQAGIDDFDRVTINTEHVQNVWNSFVPSVDNTTNSFAFEFAFESYGAMPGTLDIRIGNYDAWAVGYYYQLAVNNTWAETGVVKLYEKNGNDILITTGDIKCDLTPGARHIIEFGSIFVKNSTKTFNYVKYDGELMSYYYTVPYSNTRTTRVGLYYAGNNIFLGSTVKQAEPVDQLTFNKSDSKNGLYLYGPENDIPVSGWDVRATPASKYNALKNGEPAFASESTPLVKYGLTDYYVTFDDYHIAFADGDVFTMSDEYHFYWQNELYSMSIKPISFLFQNGAFSLIENIYDYLEGELEARYVREYYDDDKLALLDQAFEDAFDAFEDAESMKELWDVYYEYRQILDDIPINEEKALELLENAKAESKAELANYANEENYEADDYQTILGIIEDANDDIDIATSIAAVNEVLANAKEAIDAVPTKQSSIENKILNMAPGYEEYLKQYEVVTTTDLNTTGELKFYAQNSENSSFGTGARDEYSATIPTSNENKDGNMVFQFIYQSTNPSSNRYGAQLFIRLRGDGANCYRYMIGTDVNGHPGVSFAKFAGSDESAKKSYDANFEPNTPYEIKLGAIDLKDYNRVFLYIMIDDELVAAEIVDPINFVTTPNILIMDSHVANIPDDAPEDFEEDYIIMSPVENGTTKANYSTTLGRLILDNSSSSNSLIVSLKNSGNIQAGSTLLPLESGAFLINGAEIDSFRTSDSTNLFKTPSNKFIVNFDYQSLRDGDVITISGLFSLFRTTTNSKEVYRLMTSTFIYHASTESWEQEAPSLDVAKLEAKETLDNYVNMADYSNDNQTEISAIIDEYKGKIDLATTNQEVDTLLDEATTKIDAIGTLLDEYKSAAKEELNSYKSPADYRKEEKDELNSILADAFNRINNSGDKASVDLIVSETKDRLDELKTAREYDVEELASAKKAAKAEIESYVGLLESNRYSEENVTRIQSLALEARSAVNSATSQEQIDQIVANFKQSIKDIPTNDGSTFNGEGYTEPSTGGKKKCGGNILATSVILSAISLVGIALVLLKKKENY